MSPSAALRATTQDRAPIFGPLPDPTQWRLDADARHAGMLILGGLGARGLTVAPLLGEECAAAIMGEPAVLPAATLAALDPARFLRRKARRDGG